MVDPNTVMMATLEEIMNQALQQVVESYKDYKWIGQAYNLNTKDYKDANESGKLSFSLDVFPEVVEKNVTWKKHKADKYSTVVTQEDIDATVDQLRSSYAQFEDVEIVDTESLMRLKVTYQNKK